MIYSKDAQRITGSPKETNLEEREQGSSGDIRGK